MATAPAKKPDRIVLTTEQREAGVEVVKAVQIVIQRDPVTGISKLVRPWEVPIFRSLHGDDKVSIVGGQETIMDDGLPEPADEFNRLREQFGVESDTKQSHVELVYGRGKAGVELLAEAMGESVVSGNPEDAQAVVDGDTEPSEETAKKREDAYRDPLSGAALDPANLVPVRSGTPVSVAAAQTQLDRELTDARAAYEARVKAIQEESERQSGILRQFEAQAKGDPNALKETQATTAKKVAKKAGRPKKAATTE